MSIDKEELQKMINDATTSALAKQKADEEEEILSQQEYFDLNGDVLKECKYYNLKVNEEIKKKIKSKLVNLVKRGYHLQHPNWHSEKLNLIQIAENNQPS